MKLVERVRREFEPRINRFRGHRRQPLLEALRDIECGLDGRQRLVSTELRPFERVAAHKRQGADDVLVSNDARGIEIRPWSERTADVRPLLGRHVGVGAGDAGLGKRLFAVGEVSDAEVGELCDEFAVLLRQQHIRGLDVPVDESAGVGVRKTAQHGSE